MNEQEIARLEAIIKKANKNHNISDLHSFTIKITSGIAFVDCYGDYILIDIRTTEGEYKTRVADEQSAAVLLNNMNADINSIEM